MENFFHHLSTHIVNIFGFFFPKISRNDIQLIKSTKLFDEFNDATFKKALKHSHRVLFEANDPILHEGDVGDSFYIILSGSVRVFTTQLNEKIALARLEKGNYFGEQALLSPTHCVRNASVEAITDVTTLKIHEQWIAPQWRNNQKTMEQLQKIGYDEAFKILTETINHYKNALHYLQQLKGTQIKEFGVGKLIFSIGDKAHHVYLIMQGSVELLIPEKTTGKKNSFIIRRGQIFGETAILRNQPRAATALATTDVKLLRIDGDGFKKIFQEMPELRQLLEKQKTIYQLPALGIVQQYIGKMRGINMMTSIYKMENGNNIIANQSLQGDFFLMKMYEKEITQKYFYQDKFANVELGLCQNLLAEVQVSGSWDDVPSACGALIINEEITPEILQRFEATGRFALTDDIDALQKAVIICDCVMVKKTTIQDVIDSGVKNFEEISTITGACTVCKRCKYKILEMLGESQWLQATLTPLTKHNENIRSYKIKPQNPLPSLPLPGQHVVLQAKIDNLQFERAYTVSDFLEDGSLRITIKREPQGLFSNWLFNETRDSIDINISQPQGDFFIKVDDQAPAVCFAGGVGITPFIASAKHLQTARKIHIIYYALTANDFVFVDEFDQASRKNPNISIAYRATDRDGLLSKNDILELLKSFQNPDVYICGPEGFERLISETLGAIHYDRNKIHVEKFVHAGQHANAKEIA